MQAEVLNRQFKVMNWNVRRDLGPKARPTRGIGRLVRERVRWEPLRCRVRVRKVYPYCEKWALSWTWRKHLIMKALLSHSEPSWSEELKSMAVDIITLQEARDFGLYERQLEVQKDAYDEWFRPSTWSSGSGAMAGPNCWKQAMRAFSSRRNGSGLKM